MTKAINFRTIRVGTTVDTIADTGVAVIAINKEARTITVIVWRKNPWAMDEFVQTREEVSISDVVRVH